MKRIILVVLAFFALAVVAAVATKAVEIDGAPRMLLVAGAVVLLVGVVDGLRRPTLGRPTTARSEQSDTDHSDTDTEHAHAMAPEPVAAGLVDAVIDLREPSATIDLRDATGPISDDEAHTMIMVAVSQGALTEIRPRLHAVPDVPPVFTALAS